MSKLQAKPEGEAFVSSWHPRPATKHADINGLRERHLFGRTDYVCKRCVTIVLDPKTGCPACKARDEKRESAKQEFFAEAKRKKAIEDAVNQEEGE